MARIFWRFPDAAPGPVPGRNGHGNRGNGSGRSERVLPVEHSGVTRQLRVFFDTGAQPNRRTVDGDINNALLRSRQAKSGQAFQKRGGDAGVLRNGLRKAAPTVGSSRRPGPLAANRGVPGRSRHGGHRHHEELPGGHRHGSSDWRWARDVSDEFRRRVGRTARPRGLDQDQRNCRGPRDPCLSPPATPPGTQTADARPSPPPAS